MKIYYQTLISEINKLCNFLDIDYSEKLSLIKVKGSSYNRKQTKGISSDSLIKWKVNLKADEKFLIKILRPFYNKIYSNYFKS